MPKITKKKPSPVKPAAPPKAQAAFEAIEPELSALEPHELAPINIDIPQSVSTVLGVLPGLLELRTQMVAELPKLPIAYLDNLERYALGAWYTHLLAQPPASPTNPVKPLLDEATALRAALLSDAEALARRGLIDADAVAAIRAGQGHVDTANDLVALSALLTLSWSTIQGRTAATEEEVRRAGDLGPLLLAALGVREHGAAITPADAADRRARAFTLFVRAYNQVRRAVTFLRWNEGDADEIAPSLYKGRGGRGGTTSGEDGRKDTPGEREGGATPREAKAGDG